MIRTGLTTLVVLLSLAVCAQADDVYQLHYAANLTTNDSVIDITNSGATVSGGVAQNLCVNVYAFDPAEDQIACCTCSVTPSGLVSLSLRNSILKNTTTGVQPTSMEIELIASTGTCNAATVTVGQLAHGMLAWMTTYHKITTVIPAQYIWEAPTTVITTALNETPFSFGDLSAAEFAELTNTCSSIQTNDGGKGICGGCTAGGQ